MALMRQHEATLLVGVRLAPVSRVRGFSKTRLREHLESEGLGYEHLPELGNPRDNRGGYAVPGTAAAHRAHEQFRRGVLTTPRAEQAVERLAGLVDAGQVVVLLCFERDQDCCHRAQVIDAVSRSRGRDRAGSLVGVG